MKKFFSVLILLIFIFILIFASVAGAEETGEGIGARQNFLMSLIGTMADFFKKIFTRFSEIFTAAFAENSGKLVATISRGAEMIGEGAVIQKDNLIEESEKNVLSIGRKTLNAKDKKTAVPTNKTGVKKVEKKIDDHNNNDDDDDDDDNNNDDDNDYNNDYDNDYDNDDNENGSFATCSFSLGGTAKRNRVVINEVAWAGTGTSANDEWVELKNLTGSVLDISGWQIFDKNEDVKIIFESPTLIGKNSFLLLERTDDETAPDVAADLIYKGALSNKDEGLKLFSEKCGLEDEVLTETKWPAGDEKTRATMERKNDLGWQTSAVTAGTPRRENSSGLIIEPSSLNWPATGGTVLSANQTVTGSEAPNFKITEIMYDLPGSDSGREWIEVKNNGTNGYDLTKLKLFENKTNHGITFIKGNQTVGAGEYAIIADDDGKFLADNPSFNGNLLKASFSLSNTGEGIVVKNDDSVLDTVNYSKTAGAAGDGRSLQLIGDEWKAATPTPGGENTMSAAAEIYGTNLVISEMQTGGTDAGDEFMEIYNPFGEDVSLAGWSLQYFSGTVISFGSVSKKNFGSGDVAPAHGFFLVARARDSNNEDGYRGAVTPDMTHRSFSLSAAASGGVLFLMSTTTLVASTTNEAIVDYVAYGNTAMVGLATTSVPENNKSIERKSYYDGACLESAASEFEFYGNGCDTDTGGDFEIREAPRLQNSLNMKERRSAPETPTASTSDGIVSYPAGSFKIVFEWFDSKDSEGVTSSVSYELKRETATGTILVYNGTSTVYEMSIGSTTEDYVFSLVAVDRDGMLSATTTISIAAPVYYPPTAPVFDETIIDATSSVAIFSWSNSTDPDTASDLITYDFNLTSSTDFTADEWMNLGGALNATSTVAGGVFYLVGVRARDETGLTATTTMSFSY